MWAWAHFYNVLKCFSRQETSHFHLSDPGFDQRVWSPPGQAPGDGKPPGNAALSLLFILSCSQFADICIGNPHSCEGLGRC